MNRKKKRGFSQLSLGWTHYQPQKSTFIAGDRSVLIATYLLALVGLIMVFSASGVMADTRYGDAMYFLKRQAIWLLVGFIGLHWAARQNYEMWISLTPVLLGVTFVLLVLVPVLGAEINGARRWFRLAGFSLQPAELCKLVVVLYLAWFLMRKEEHVRSFRRGVLAPVLVVGVFAGLVLMEPDMGTAVVLMLVLASLLFLGGARISHLLGFVLALTPLAYGLVMGSEYRRRRLMSFLDPWRDPENTGFQLTQSFVALGNGGVMGVGLGEGKQKLFFLPEAHSDFVLALVGEELGFLGTTMLMVLFSLIIIKGFRIAGRAPDAYGRYLASGITLLIGIQALINSGVVSGLLPTKGLTLPFVSYGGSSLIVSLMAVGILLSVSRECPTSRPWNPFQTG